jgi:protein ImuA
MIAPSPTPDALVPPPLTDLRAGLEEACATTPRDMAATLAFALARVPAGDRRGVGLALTRAWLSEHGRPYGPGLARFGRAEGVLLIVCRTQAEALWTMEQALKSGGLSLV